MYKFTVEVNNLPVLVEAFEKRFSAVKLGPSSDGTSVRFSMEGENRPSEEDMKPYLAKVVKAFAWQEVPANMEQAAKGAFDKPAKAKKAPVERPEGAPKRGRPSRAMLLERAAKQAQESAASLELKRAQELLLVACAANVVNA